MHSSSQPSLFSQDNPADQSQAAAARARMLDMIEKLTAASTPPWKDQMAVILDDGTFQRAMPLVPTEEAQSLWTRFDTQMERLYAIWAQARQAADPAHTPGQQQPTTTPINDHAL